MYRYLKRYIKASCFDNLYFTIILIVDGNDNSATDVMWMSMLQLNIWMAPSTVNGETIDDVSMASP
jgi:hypothetical protein